MKRKAQSALEYMMTYGWAILIIVIVAGVLYSLGIFNPSANSGTTATGFSPFVVLGQDCGPATANHGLRLQLGNNAGTTVTLTGETIGSSVGLTGTTVGNLTSNAVTAGASIILGFTPTTTGCSSPGARYSATISITYTESTTVGSQTLTATGTISGTASTT